MDRPARKPIPVLDPDSDAGRTVANDLSEVLGRVLHRIQGLNSSGMTDGASRAEQ